MTYNFGTGTFFEIKEDKCFTSSDKGINKDIIFGEDFIDRVDYRHDVNKIRGYCCRVIYKEKNEIKYKDFCDIFFIYYNEKYCLDLVFDFTKRTQRCIIPLTNNISYYDTNNIDTVTLKFKCGTTLEIEMTSEEMNSFIDTLKSFIDVNLLNNSLT